MAQDIFAVPVFFIVFRETIETVIIVSILLAWLKQTLDGPNKDQKAYKALTRQVWLGTGIGLFICLVVAGGLIGAFYTLGSNTWEQHEYYYEGAFALFASIIITIVGAALLRVGKMQEKWRLKLAKALESPVQTKKKGCFKHFAEKYAMFVLPFVTILREGIEAIVFIAGVSFSTPAKAVPLPVVVGLIAGCIVGYILYKGGASTKLQLFLVLSTCLLYLVAAGLFSRAIWYFEEAEWNKAIGGEASEFGTGPGSYDISKSVWHVNCCSPNYNGGGGWGIFNALLGWTNSATYGSVIGYNVYWIVVILGFIAMRYKEVKGHWPLRKAKEAPAVAEYSSSGSSNDLPSDRAKGASVVREELKSS
ncbi:hypothetical protein MKZ38_008436 [Zalerion maritima]|uniref:Uncharacterized protein n=1 Tax=Zalerion maritima TaxID=339359 RepID=A0AAD5RHI3_9PEZI|nr:hypothetical protein MKZ38_008436 [Zalerion maritima]